MLFWRRSSAVYAALLLGFAVFGESPARAQTLGDLARVNQRATIPSTVLPSTAGSASATGAALFGTTEFQSPSLQGLPQWTRVLKVVRREQARFEACTRDAERCTTPTLRNWRKIIKSAAKLERAGKIRAVNEFFNRWPYKEDSEIYGRSEYWATPSEFMARSGDCEDYAIAKYFALRQLGFGEQEMRVVILMDEIRGIGHAILAIYEADEIIVLDSLSNMILPHVRYKHYRPQYSMNETNRWAHVGGYKNKPATYRGLVARQN